MERTGGLSAQRWAGRLDLRIVFAGFALIFLAIIPPTNYNTDGESMLAVASSLATDLSFTVPCGKFTAESGRGGDCYSTFYPLISVIGAPFVLVGRQFGSLAGIPQSYTGELFALVVPALAAAGAATLTAALALKLGAGRRAALLAAVALAFCTEIVTYARTYFAETLAAFFVALAVWGLTETGRRRRWGYAAIVLAILAKPQMVLVGPALGLALALTQRRVRPLLETGAATAVGSLIYLGYNWLRWEDLTDFGGETREVHAAAYSFGEASEALGVLLVSPGRGMIWFSPIVLAGAVALWRRRRTELALASLLVFAAILLVYTGNPGIGRSWGDRYLAPALPLFCAALVTLRGRWVKVAVALGVAGFLVALPTIVTDYHRYFEEQRERGYTSSELYWKFPPGPVGMWPSGLRQLQDAADADVNDLVEESEGREAGDTLEEQPPLLVVSLWWWMLPAAGIPAALGALVALAMMAAGGLLLWRAGWRSPKALARPPPAAA